MYMHEKQCDSVNLSRLDEEVESVEIDNNQDSKNDGFLSLSDILEVANESCNYNYTGGPTPLTPGARCPKSPAGASCSTPART